MAREPRVLLVDDEEDVRGLLKRVLERNGYTVDPAASTAEALSAFSRNRYAVVVSDICMPGLPVENMLRCMAAMERGLRVLLITGRATPKQIVAAHSPACTGVLLKPFDTQEFVEAVRRTRFR